MDDAEVIITALRKRFPHIAGPKKDDICYATQNRQEAVKELMPEADLVLVVGSQNSSNSLRLAELARSHNKPAYLVDGVREIQPSWLHDEQTVLITAGASAPEDVVPGAGRVSAGSLRRHRGISHHPRGERQFPVAARTALDPGVIVWPFTFSAKRKPCKPGNMDKQAVIEHTCRWISSIVIGLNLCPFAQRVFAAGKIRYAVSEARDEKTLFNDLSDELKLLASSPIEAIETTLLIHPHVFADFLDYNDFVGVAEELIEDLDLLGIVQIASFHPQYLFAETDPDAAENYTNRSPYPMLHLLREESITAVAGDPAELLAIPPRNIKTLQSLGRRKSLKSSRPLKQTASPQASPPRKRGEYPTFKPVQSAESANRSPP